MKKKKNKTINKRKKKKKDLRAKAVGMRIERWYTLCDAHTRWPIGDTCDSRDMELTVSCHGPPKLATRAIQAIGGLFKMKAQEDIGWSHSRPQPTSWKE